MAAVIKDDDKLGITVITGFLGSGKTTLLNRILSETHGLKLAVIENEFGEVGIDDKLVKQSINLNGQNEEKNICLEMNNGCICCTVRADMAKAVASMLELHRSGKKLDGIIIETTGMADPAPVVQTFFVDKNLASGVFLDGVITVVDAKHIHSHLNDKDGKEAFQQISYADRVILNKTDLVTAEELTKVNDEIYRINSSAMIIETIKAKVDVKKLLNIRAFELDRILKSVDPQFLETNLGHDHDHDHDGDHDCKSHDSCDHHSHGHGHGEKKGHGDHGHGHGHGQKKNAERRKTRHSSKVNSVAVVRKGDVDYDVLVDWLTNMLQESGLNIYRMKGLLNMEEEDGLFVLQGVHQLWDLSPVGLWSEPRAERLNKLVFIGKDLDRKFIEEGVECCIIGTDAHKEAREEMEQLWRVQAFWETQKGSADAEREEQKLEKTYKVSVHNGLHGMGMLLSERQSEGGRPEVYVAGFATMPEGVANNAVETALIVPGDSLRSVNGHSLEHLPLKEAITILRRIPRGAGVTGATAKLVMGFGPDDPLPGTKDAAVAPAAKAAEALPTDSDKASSEAPVETETNSTQQAKRKKAEDAPKSQAWKKQRVWKN